METTKQQHTQRPIIFDPRWYIICATLTLGIWLFISSLGALAFPLFVSILLHYSTRPLAALLSRYLKPRLVHSAMALMLVALMCWFVLIVIPDSVMQLESVIRDLPRAMVTLSNQMNTYIKEHAPSIMDTHLLSSQQQWLSQITNSLKDITSSTLIQLANGLKNTISSVLSMTLVPIFYYVLGRYSSSITASMSKWVPSSLSPTAQNWINDIDHLLSTYVYGQVSIILILMTCYSIGLLILQLPFAILLGCIAGLMVLIPVVGHGISFTMSVMVAISVFPEAYQCIGYLVLLYGCMILLESLWITPHFLGQVMGLSAICVLALIAFGHQWFGVWGILLATPVVTIGQYILSKTYHIYTHSQFYHLARWPGKTPSS